ncbi:WD40 repeat-like protein [Pseudovirgaria hyperparasitica]|uniref:WD40 repeat-like protein n=1 Tax=Pseudovirgaria hyperparasitica TaxID=470096 RepID=A0A6A6W9A4_9PEZI|nr:WD40 repeat-like protein [Pseudovirgaria hyperparasitica]KAF2759432.1 WD40 repeat-like protein [Pseudovirgaria hyperparasitica]
MSLFGQTASAATAANPAQGDIKSDVPVTNPPEDSISALAWSSAGDYLSASSWDKKTYVYQVQAGVSSGLTTITHEKPALDTCWSSDGTKVFSAGADKAVFMVDMNNMGQGQKQVAAHDDTISCVRILVVNGKDMLVTGSWDKTIRYWDLTSSTPQAQVTVAERVYTMDTKNNLLVVGTADRWIEVFDVSSNPSVPVKKLQSPLKWQTRVVSCFNDASGYAVGSIEGRCAIQYVKDSDSGSNFSFKCHRQNDTNNRDVAKVYSVNCISFHPVHGTFSTAGADGTFHFWDKDAKHRLKGYPEVGGTISATAFNRNGEIFAYAVSYDWSQGFQGNNPNYPNKIMLHPVGADECKPRPGSKKR